ncbi:MAG: hypothetical protein AAF612_11525, partial [Planctomycetota bacterium]
RKRALSEVQAKINKVDQDYAQINRDQQRVRENMRGLDRNSPLYGTYVEKLTAQEGEVDKLQAQRVMLRQELAAREAELAEHVKNLNVEG